MRNVPEENLDGDPRDCSVALVGDVPVKVSDLPAGKIRRLAHCQLADGEVGGVWVRCGGGGHHLRAMLAVAVDNYQANYHCDDDGSRNSYWQPVTLLRFCGTNQLGTSAHERNSTPVTEGIPVPTKLLPVDAGVAEKRR